MRESNYVFDTKCTNIISAVAAAAVCGCFSLSKIDEQRLYVCWSDADEEKINDHNSHRQTICDEQN